MEESENNIESENFKVLEKEFDFPENFILNVDGELNNLISSNLNLNGLEIIRLVCKHFLSEEPYYLNRDISEAFIIGFALGCKAKK